MSKSPIATDRDWLKNPTPAEILLEEFLRLIVMSMPWPARRQDRRRGWLRRSIASQGLRQAPAGRSPAHSPSSRPSEPCAHSARPRRTVVPRFWISPMIWNTACMTTGARPSEGSSSSSRRGFAMRPRATATICCWPPESVQPSASANGLMLGKEIEHRVSLTPDRSCGGVPVRGAEHDVLAHGQAGKDAPALGNMSDAELDDRARAKPADRFAVEQDRAGVRRGKAGNRAQRGRLARAVGAQQRNDRALVDCERDAAQGFDLAVRDAEVLDFKQRHQETPR